MTVTAVRLQALDLAVIVVTSSPSLETARAALGLSVVAYLDKPCAADELMRHVREALGRVRLAQLTREARARADKMAADLRELSASMSGPVRTSLAGSAASLLALTLSDSVLAGLNNVSWLVDACLQTNMPALSKLVEGPLVAQQRALLTETVAVLQNTKSAFKSKDLGALRKKLQAFLESV